MQPTALQLQQCYCETQQYTAGGPAPFVQRHWMRSTSAAAVLPAASTALGAGVDSWIVVTLGCSSSAAAAVVGASGLEAFLFVLAIKTRVPLLHTDYIFGNFTKSDGIIICQTK